MPKPLPESWATFGIGRSGFWLTANVNSRERYIYCAIGLTGKNAKAHFAMLERQKESIERELDASLEWMEKPGKVESHIYLRWNDEDPSDRSRWNKQHEWLLEKLEMFDRTFRERVKQLDASEIETARESVSED